MILTAWQRSEPNRTDSPKTNTAMTMMVRCCAGDESTESAAIRRNERTLQKRHAVVMIPVARCALTNWGGGGGIAYMVFVVAEVPHCGVAPAVAPVGEGRRLVHLLHVAPPVAVVVASYLWSTPPFIVLCHVKVANICCRRDGTKLEIWVVC